MWRRPGEYIVWSCKRVSACEDVIIRHQQHFVEVGERSQKTCKSHHRWESGPGPDNHGLRSSFLNVLLSWCSAADAYWFGWERNLPPSSPSLSTLIVFSLQVTIAEIYIRQTGRSSCWEGSRITGGRSHRTPWCWWRTVHAATPPQSGCRTAGGPDSIHLSAHSPLLIWARRTTCLHRSSADWSWSASLMSPVPSVFFPLCMWTCSVISLNNLHSRF